MQAQRLGGREPHLCRGSRTATSCPRPAAWCNYRPPEEGREDGDHGAQRHRRLRGRRNLDLLRSDDRQAGHACRRPPRRAIDAQARALDAFVIDGIRHNIPFLSALMQHPRWRSGNLSTGFIAEEYPGRLHAARREGEIAHAHGGGRGHRRPCRQRSASARSPARCAAQRRSSSSASASVAAGRRCSITVELDAERGRLLVRFVEGGHAAPPRIRPGCRASRSGTARSTASRPSVQVRPILNGFRSPIAA